MSYAYNEMYLSDAMMNLGEMTEYAHDAFGVDPDRALRYFIISGYAERFEVGDPAVVSGTSGTELYIYSAEKCCAGLSVWPNPIVKYETEEYYWLGYILALFQWKTGYSFGSILSKVKAKDILRLYPALHTVAEDNAVDVILRIYRETSQLSRIQEYRKRLGMTQAQLAKASGVNIRTLQQYEAGTKSVKKAAAETVFSLAAALECQPEELIV